VKLRFDRHRRPRALDDLTVIEQAQLVACGKAYDGRDCTAEECLPIDGDEEVGLFGLEVWDVVDDDAAGAAIYTMWIYQVDSGTIFQAGTTTVVAMFIQFGLECSDAVLAAALADAHAAHASWPDGTSLPQMSLGNTP